MPYLVLTIILIIFSILDIYYLKSYKSKKNVMIFLELFIFSFLG